MGYVQPVDGLKLADFYNGAPKLSEAKKLSRNGIRSFKIFNVERFTLSGVGVADKWDTFNPSTDSS